MQPTHEQLAEQLDRIETLIRDHIHDSMVWRTRTDAKIAENTEITEHVQAIATTGKTLRSALIWIGGLAGGLVGIWQLWQIMSPGIGPTP